jgi:two-component system, cell cycle sensor histidine kinase and response regulator CckA
MEDASTFRILVVDDESSVLITYQLILEQQGYVVSACATSAEAIRTLQQQDFDLVLCDYSLEEQHTGFEVIDEARRRKPEIPAALLTGYATKETADEASAQSIGIMFKPIEIEEFLATTSKMLRRDHEPDEKSGEKTVGSR